MKPFNVFPYGSRIDFMRMGGASILISVLLVVISLGAMGYNTIRDGAPFNFALDFTGGMVSEIRFERPVDVDDVRARLDAAGFEGAQVQTFGSGDDLLVRLRPEGEEVAGAEQSDINDRTGRAVAEALAYPDNPGQVMRNEFVGPQVGRDLALNGMWALIFVIVGFLIYISMRFERKFAIAAVLTSLHDVIVVAGWFAITGHEFDLTVLAGLLSVLGFSINDTIVVFDRIRENFRGMRANATEIINASINQTLSRTVITSLVSLLTMLALYFYGGGSLAGMAEAMIMGVIFGTLSSIFVAAPLLERGALKVTKQDLMPKAKDEAELARRP